MPLFCFFQSQPWKKITESRAQSRSSSGTTSVGGWVGWVRSRSPGTQWTPPKLQLLKRPEWGGLPIPQRGPLGFEASSSHEFFQDHLFWWHMVKVKTLSRYSLASLDWSQSRNPTNLLDGGEKPRNTYVSIKKSLDRGRKKHMNFLMDFLSST